MAASTSRSGRGPEQKVIEIEQAWNELRSTSDDRGPGR